jgi:hypothetical protein
MHLVVLVIVVAALDVDLDLRGVGFRLPVRHLVRETVLPFEVGLGPVTETRGDSRELSVPRRGHD